MKTSSQGLFPASWSFMLAGAPSDLEIHGATTQLAQCHTAGPRLASTKLHETETRCPRPGRPTRLRLLLKPGYAGCRGAPQPFRKAGRHVTALLAPLCVLSWPGPESLQLAKTGQDQLSILQHSRGMLGNLPPFPFCTADLYGFIYSPSIISLDQGDGMLRQQQSQRVQ